MFICTHVNVKKHVLYVMKEHAILLMNYFNDEQSTCVFFFKYLFS